jgi:hypothetical protein
MDVSNSTKSSSRSDSGAGAGIWITLIGAIVTISALEHLTKWPWYATYPLALIAGLLITAGYLKLKESLLRKS